jgi:hypothetical protein
MNSNKESLKENYNRINAKRSIGKSKGNVWKSKRRNSSI